MTPQLVSLAKDLAQKAGVDPALCCAVIEQESSWCPTATRFEALFFKHYIAPMKLPDLVEATNRATSFGLMQLMGEVAREQGFQGPLTGLFDPITGVTQGLIHLSHFLKLENGNVTAALLRWNGGANKLYPGEVVARISKYR